MPKFICESSEDQPVRISLEQDGKDVDVYAHCGEESELLFCLSGIDGHLEMYALENPAIKKHFKLDDDGFIDVNK